MHYRVWLAALFALLPIGCRGTATMITSEPFGEVEGQPVQLFTMESANGIVMKVTNYGSTVTSIETPDRDGKLADIVLGYDGIDGYVNGSSYFGAMVGRVANRIARGKFELDGHEYQLATNNGPNHLHGGVRGFNKVVWDAEVRGSELVLSYHSPDGEEGYPGNLDVRVVYRLTGDGAFEIDATATTDRATPVNLAHHSYWNLGGHDSGSILDHQLQLAASRYTPTDATLIPTGVIAPVVGTPFDFCNFHAIGKWIDRLLGNGAADPGGYDLNYVLDERPTELKLAAQVFDPKSGRSLEVWTTEPGVQFYSGNFLSGEVGKSGARYEKHGAFCLETQHYPDAVNHQGDPQWPTVVLRPGEVYRHRMIHRFGVVQSAE